MTELQKMYFAARAGNKRGHHAALRHMARQTGIDEASLGRCLQRARRTDEREAKINRKAAA